MHDITDQMFAHCGSAALHCEHRFRHYRSHAHERAPCLRNVTGRCDFHDSKPRVRANSICGFTTCAMCLLRNYFKTRNLVCRTWSHDAFRPSVAPRAERRDRSAARQPKDPDTFEDYDAIRASLHDASGLGGFVSGIINFLSGTAFGSRYEVALLGGAY